MTIRSLFEEWSAQRLIRKCYSRPHDKSVAVGFAWGREGVGGMRNHLEAIQQYSTIPVKLFPETSLLAWVLARPESRADIVRAILDKIPLTEFGVVHSHVDPEFIRACHSANQSGVPWIHTYHTLYFPEDWGGSLLPWQIEINDCLINVASKADVRISISPWLQTLLREHYRIETVVIPNGYNPALCAAASHPGRNPEGDLTTPYFLYVGSLFDVKNPRLFVELAAKLPDQQFVMIGKDLSPEKVIARFRIELPANLLLLGPKSHSATLRMIFKSKALVGTSHSEGLPTVVMEAMALGTLVIVPDSHGCRDLIQHEENGLKYPPGDLSKLAALVSKPISEALGKQAAKDAAELYAWPSVARRLDTLYEGLLNA